jgi:competence protein ComEC
MTGDPLNDNAVVVIASIGTVRALLTSDAEGPLLLTHDLPTVTLLQVPHHGSVDSRLSDLLDLTQPSAATISVGAGNRYGHPDASVIDELQRRGIHPSRTDREGTVAYETDGRTLWRIDTT